MDSCFYCREGQYEMEQLVHFYDQDGNIIEIYQCKHCKRVLVITIPRS